MSKQEAKNDILTGLGSLAILIFGYLLLQTINPDILNLDIGVRNIELNPDGDYVPPPGSPGNESGSVMMTTGNLPNIAGLYCPGSGGIKAIPQIAESFKGRTTYRMGAKGGPLAPGKTYADGNRKCEGGGLCKTFCPPNTVCSDCSGFINIVLKCAGLPSNSSLATANIFDPKDPKVIRIKEVKEQGANVIVIDSNNQSHIVGLGDLIGKPTVGNNVGHVLIYAGNKMFADSHGGDSGRKAGNAIGFNSIKKVQKYTSFRKQASYP